MCTCVACCQRLAKEFCRLFVLFQAQFGCQHCVSIILVALRKKYFTSNEEINNQNNFSKIMLTYFVNRLKCHLGINFIRFRICLHKKYVPSAQLVKHKKERKKKIQLNYKWGN